MSRTLGGHKVVTQEKYTEIFWKCFPWLAALGSFSLSIIWNLPKTISNLEMCQHFNMCRFRFIYYFIWNTKTFSSKVFNDSKMKNIEFVKIWATEPVLSLFFINWCPCYFLDCDCSDGRSCMYVTKQKLCTCMPRKAKLNGTCVGSWVVYFHCNYCVTKVLQNF